MYTYATDVKEFWYPSKTEFKKNGEPKLKRGEVRKLLLSNPNSLFEPKQYRITIVRRKTPKLDENGKQVANDEGKKVYIPITKFAVSGLYPPVKTKWNHLVLDTRLMPTEQWKKAEQSMTQEQLTKWLSFRISDAADAIYRLFNDEPQNKKEAA